jgi:hypothetical protein
MSPEVADLLKRALAVDPVALRVHQKPVGRQTT